MQIYNSKKEPKIVFTSKYVGVMWHSTKKQWRAAISIFGNKRVLGYIQRLGCPELPQGILVPICPVSACQLNRSMQHHLMR